MTVYTQDKPVIVLDVGKVLVELNPAVLLEELSRRCGRKMGLPLPPELDELFLPIYVGARSWADVLPDLNSTLGLSLQQDEWQKLWCRVLTGEVPGMSAVLAELKREFRLVALSNTEAVHWAHLLRECPIMGLLDGWVVSYEERVAKPDPSIYRAVVDRYCPDRTPFFYTDDIPSYVAAARRLGWDAEVFTDAAQFKKKLGKLRGHAFTL
jgi:FMN phosphatase YigB (HAD superfamily)